MNSAKLIKQTLDSSGLSRSLAKLARLSNESVGRNSKAVSEDISHLVS